MRTRELAPGPSEESLVWFQYRLCDWQKKWSRTVLRLEASRWWYKDHCEWGSGNEGGSMDLQVQQLGLWFLGDRCLSCGARHSGKSGVEWLSQIGRQRCSRELYQRLSG